VVHATGNDCWAGYLGKIVPTAFTDIGRTAYMLDINKIRQSRVRPSPTGADAARSSTVESTIVRLSVYTQLLPPVTQCGDKAKGV